MKTWAGEKFQYRVGYPSAKHPAFSFSTEQKCHSCPDELELQRL